MSHGCNPLVWEYVRPSSSFQNTGTYAPPATPRVHAFPAGPRTEPVEFKMQSPVGGIGTDICRGRQNPYRGGLGSFDLRFTYLREGGHQVSRSPGPGNYETRHLTGGALVKRPNTASPCFRRPSGRLQFEGGGTWHEDSPLESAERRGTVRGSIKEQPRQYSLSFRSKAERLVVNKPRNTTHEGLGPGCYDLSKDGKSVGIRTEKRVVRQGCSGRGSTNQFLVDWRAYMKRPPKVNDGYGGCSSGCGSEVAKGRHHEDSAPSPSRAFHDPPATPQKVQYALNSRSESWSAERNRPPVGAGRRGGGFRSSGLTSSQVPRTRQHQVLEGSQESLFPRRQEPQQQKQHCESPLHGRTKRPASAMASLRVPITTGIHALPRRCYALPGHSRNSGGRDSGGGGIGSGGRWAPGAGVSEPGSYVAAVSTASASFSGQQQLALRPPSVNVASRPHTTGSANIVRVNYVEGCRGGDGRQSVRGEGRAGILAATRTTAPLDNRQVGQPRGGVVAPSPAGVVHHIRLPRTANSTAPDDAATGESYREGVEEGPPPEASPPDQYSETEEVPPKEGTVLATAEETGESGAREGKGGDLGGDRSGDDSSIPTTGINGSAPNLPTEAVATGPGVKGSPDFVGGTADTGGVGTARGGCPGSGDTRAARVSSGPSGVAIGFPAHDGAGCASSRLTASPPPPSDGRGACCSGNGSTSPSRSGDPAGDVEAVGGSALTGARPVSASPPPPATSVTSSGEEASPVIAVARKPSGQMVPEPPLPWSRRSVVRGRPRTSSLLTSKVSNGLSGMGTSGGGGAVKLVRSKNPFQPVLDVIESRSSTSSRRGSTGSTESHLSFDPAPPFSDVSGPRNMKSDDGQAAAPARRWFKSFRVLEDSNVLSGVDGDLGVLPDPEQEEQPADLAIKEIATNFVGETISAAVTRQQTDAAVSGLGSGCPMQV